MPTRRTHGEGIVPEGDTLHRAARGLRRVLAGSAVRRFDSPLAAVRLAARGLEGSRIDSVEARGKHLLIHFSDGRALRTHLRMSGSWHLYRPGETWRKPIRRARAVIETDRAVAVCFNAPEVEILSGGAARSGGAAGRIGPDLLAQDFDAAGIAARWAARPELPLGVAVMRQHLAAGIGNVYKSEVLFLCGLDPFRPVADHSRQDLERVATTARRELLRNLGPGPRRTRNALDGGRYWVYRRSRKPCRQCGTRVEMRRQGEDGRSTYYCPACQGVSRTTGATSAKGIESIDE